MNDLRPQARDAALVLDPLREVGRRRTWRRFQPTRDRPAFTRVVSVAGWKLGLRDVYDLSMGGISVVLEPGEAPEAQVGAQVQVSLNLGERTIQVLGRISHISPAQPALGEPKRLGVAFQPGAGFMAGRAAVSTYLWSLLRG